MAVWKLDRPGRSLGHLIQILDDLTARGVHFESLTEKIETAAPYGEFELHLISALAHMKRRLIGERTREGMATVKRRGKHISPLTKSVVADSI